MLGQPVNTAGDEHFKQALRRWSFSSTPVFDNHGRRNPSSASCSRVCGLPQRLRIQADSSRMNSAQERLAINSHACTCALSLASMLGQPVNTAGDEHFKQALRRWSFSSTPVFVVHTFQQAVHLIKVAVRFRQQAVGKQRVTHFAGDGRQHRGRRAL
jgi:hypothetical protein